MIVPDVNVLVLAHRSDSTDHKPVRAWLEDEVNSDRPVALADIAVSGFIRVTTNPRVFRDPTPLESAIGFIEGLLGRETCLSITAGPRHWEIFCRVLRGADARANLVPDAHLAAISIEHGCTVATRDRGFARFDAVRWVDPLAA